MLLPRADRLETCHESSVGCVRRVPGAVDCDFVLVGIIVWLGTSKTFLVGLDNRIDHVLRCRVAFLIRYRQRLSRPSRDVIRFLILIDFSHALWQWFQAIWVGGLSWLGARTAWIDRVLLHLRPKSVTQQHGTDVGVVDHAGATSTPIASGFQVRICPSLRFKLNTWRLGHSQRGQP